MSNHNARFNRRRFLKGAASTGAICMAPSLIPGSALGMDGSIVPSQRITFGGVGIGRRGSHDLGCLLRNNDVQFVAISDCWRERRESVKRRVDEHHRNQDCKLYRDFREMLERPDIDAVLITTGDRWHTMASVTAAKAGKDVYSEKPCSTTIAESRALADAFAKYGRVYQAGTQRRSIGNFQFAADLAHGGKLGKIHTVHANTLYPPTNHEWLPAEPEPPKDEIDWDMWLGPCPWRPFNMSYLNGRWRGHFDFHGGGILEWGAHTVDLCQWGAEKDHTTPVEYEPTERGCVATYADGMKLIMRDSGWMGLGTCSARYEGDEGWVETGDTGKIAVYPESLRLQNKVFTTRGTDAGSHIRNFLDCIKTREQPAANAAVAARSHIVSHAAYIAWQLGRTLKFDPVKEEFLGDEEANRMRSRAMRAPWRI